MRKKVRIHENVCKHHQFQRGYTLIESLTASETLGVLSKCLRKWRRKVSPETLHFSASAAADQLACCASSDQFLMCLSFRFMAGPSR